MISHWLMSSYGLESVSCTISLAGCEYKHVGVVV